MDTSKLKSAIIGRIPSLEGMQWIWGYTDHGSFRPDASPEGSITTEQKGQWLWVRARFGYTGSTMDQTTDRLGGDPYYAEIAFDWIGIEESAPKKAAKLEDLDDWAIIKTHYVLENNDVGYWGSHNGEWVESVTEEGIVTIRAASGRYEDVDPISTTSVEEIDLTKKASENL